MIEYFISDSVPQKFFRFAYAKFLIDFFSKMRGRNKNFVEVTQLTNVTTQYGMTST